ncbi:MAG: hypothetical protein U0572_14580 [Phycisphaerales bacterium]
MAKDRKKPPAPNAAPSSPAQASRTPTSAGRTGAAPPSPPTPGPRATISALATWIVRLAALWVLAGATAKSLTGTPAELPAPILALDFDPFAVIIAAIVVETTIALVALVAPRLGWAPLAALLATFAIILVLHLRSGAESCGCFGGALPIPAWLVLAVDSSLLVATLAAARFLRPWRAARQAGLGALVGLVVGLALAWYADDRMRTLRPVESLAAAKTPAPQQSGAKNTAPQQSAPPQASPPSAAPQQAAAQQATTAQTAAPAATAWRLPDAFPPQVILRPVQWIGKKLDETELGRWADTSKFPPDATIIIYYASCNHCADHLRELAAKKAADPASAPNYVLVQIPTPDAYAGRLFVDRVPDGALHVLLPKEIKAWVITPPWDVFVEGGVVKRAERVQWSGEPGAKKPS